MHAHDFFSSLFSTDFMTRDHCGCWNSAFRILYIASQIGIAAAYATVPVVLWIVTTSKVQTGQRLTGSPRVRILTAYALTFSTCGIGHLADGVLTFWLPAYHLWAVWHFVTAMVSWWALAVSVRYRVELISGGLL